MVGLHFPFFVYSYTYLICIMSVKDFIFCKVTQIILIIRKLLGIFVYQAFHFPFWPKFLWILGHF